MVKGQYILIVQKKKVMENHDQPHYKRAWYIKEYFCNSYNLHINYSLHYNKTSFMKFYKIFPNFSQFLMFVHKKEIEINKTN